MLAVAGLVLLLAACDDSDEVVEEEDLDAPGDEELPEEMEDLEELEELEDLEGLEDMQPEVPDPVDLPEGVAATVDGDEITDEEVEAEAEGIDVPEGQEEQVYAAALNQLIIDEVLDIGAGELGVTVDEGDIADMEAEIEAEADAEQVEAMLEQQGISREEFIEQQALIQAIVQEVVGDVEPDADEEELAEAQAAMQQWETELFAGRDIEVDESYGVWSPETMQIMPAPEDEQE